MKRFSCFRHAVLHSDSACCRNVSVFYSGMLNPRNNLCLGHVDAVASAWSYVASWPHCSLGKRCLMFRCESRRHSTYFQVKSSLFVQQRVQASSDNQCNVEQE